MRFIVGLGNPGNQYEKTRHNIGFLVLDEMARRGGGEFRSKKSVEGDITEVEMTQRVADAGSGLSLVEPERMLLLKPMTYMNASGRAVRSTLSKYPVKVEELIVVYDDADLAFGDVRFKQGGGSAGHRGMVSLLGQFPKGTNIARIRVGIGRSPHPDVPLDQFVLGRWTKDEEAQLPIMIDKAISLILEQGSDV